VNTMVFDEVMADQNREAAGTDGRLARPSSSILAGAIRPENASKVFQTKWLRPNRSAIERMVSEKHRIGEVADA
jgi:hypothetical protein